MGDPRYGQIALRTTVTVQHLGIDDRSDGFGYVVGADPRQGRLGITAHHHELRERTLIEHRDPFARGLMLQCHTIEPGRPSEGMCLNRLVGRFREPVRPFPAELLTETGTGRAQAFIERRPATGSPALMFLMRPGDRVVFAVGLERTFTDPLGVAVRRTEAPDIHGPQIVGLFAVGHPFRERHTGTTAGGDAERVESRADEKVREFGGLPEDEVAT